MILFEKLPSGVLAKIPAAGKVLSDDDNVLFGYLFGGLAADSPKPLSDIDIAVYVRNTDNLSEYRLDLFDKLTKALGTAELDLIILNIAPLSIAGRVLQNKQVLTDRDPFKRHSYESVTRREFFDFRVKEETFFKRRYGIGR